MMSDPVNETKTHSARQALLRLLEGYSAEVATPDRKSIDAAAAAMPTGAPVYIASLPKDTADRQIETAAQLRAKGLEPVPHIVARNIASRAALDEHLARLSEAASVTRALVLGGDRDAPAGDFESSLQLVETGLFQKYGVTKVAIGCYPEGHPRIPDDVLKAALTDKLAAAAAAGLDMRLISQLCFDADAIIRFVRSLRESGVTAKFRVGVAGPAKRSTLVKYAMICGVGPSLRALSERKDVTRGLIAAQTPEALLTDIAAAMMREPALDILGVHFFTFASLKNTISWAEETLGRLRDETVRPNKAAGADCAA